MRRLVPLLLVLAACADGPAPAPNPEGLEAPTAGAPPLPPSETPYFVLGTDRGRFPHLRPPATPGDTAARRAFVEAIRKASRQHRAFEAEFNDAADWRDADALVRREVGPDSLVPHGLAVTMLDRHLLRGPLDDPDKVEALGRYTRTLLAHRSAEGAVMLWALLRLDGHWEEGSRRSAARASAARLGGPFAQVAGCVGCTVEEALAGMWPEARRAAEGRLYDMQTVHEQLMRIAQGDTPMPDGGLEARTSAAR